MTLVLASSSPIRQTLLRNAGLEFMAVPAQVDEEALRQSFLAEGVSPRDQADHLAELKAAKVAARNPESTVIGCDQILEIEGEVLGKPRDEADLRGQLYKLRGRTHRLVSAVVVYEKAEPVWRHIGVARLTMRDFSDSYLDAYLSRNAQAVLKSVGGYQLESEGVRLFDRIEGDYFTILGLPLIPLLTWLGQRGLITA